MQQLSKSQQPFLSGIFLQFHEDEQALEIMIENEIYFYPLINYYSQRVPFPDSLVLIFSIENSNPIEPYILGFEKAHMILPSEVISSKILTINILNQKVMINTKEQGNVMLDLSEDFLSQTSIKRGEELMLRKVQFGKKTYFLPYKKHHNISTNFKELYKILTRT